MLASSLFLRLRRPLLPQILQACCFLCCKASWARSMQPMPVHPFRSSLDRHFLGEVSVGSTPPSLELTSSASVYLFSSVLCFPSEHVPQFSSRRWLCSCCVVSHLECKFSDGQDRLTVVQRDWLFPFWAEVFVRCGFIRQFLLLLPVPSVSYPRNHRPFQCQEAFSRCFLPGVSGLPFVSSLRFWINFCVW